eukprot:3585042-Rhodomonas_salina.3
MVQRLQSTLEGVDAQDRERRDRMQTAAADVPTFLHLAFACFLASRRGGEEASGGGAACSGGWPTGGTGRFALDSALQSALLCTRKVVFVFDFALQSAALCTSLYPEGGVSVFDSAAGAGGGVEEGAGSARGAAQGNPGEVAGVCYVRYSHSVWGGICYGMPGTGLAYGVVSAMRWPVLA